MDNKKQDSELVPLSNAVVIVYRQVMGADIALADNSQANDIAHAIANVAPVYGVGAHNKEGPKPIPPIDLLHGAFQRGATVLRTPKGIEYEGLCMQSMDLSLAINVLKTAGVRFGR